jgi:hypothetical protein
MAKRRKMSGIEGNEFLPNSGGNAVLNTHAQAVMASIVTGKLQFYPATICYKDGDITGKSSAARPLIKRKCVDLEKSGILDWNTLLNSFYKWTKLVYLNDCLGNDHIVREANTRKVVVSDQLRNAMLPFVKHPGVFCRPQDYTYQ